MADFWLQGDDDVVAKKQFRLFAYLKHAVIHAMAAYSFAGLWFVWQIPAVVLVSHPLIDGLKEASLRWLAPRDADGKPVARWKFWTIIVDQALHVAVLAAMVAIFSFFDTISVEPYWSALLGNTLRLKTLVLLSGAIATILAGGVLVGILVQPLLQEIRDAYRSGGITPEQRGLENGGRLIGQLERALILLFILSGQPMGVGFLIAAKSIFRFGELKDNATRMEAEYIIIGTMLSFAWALAVVWLTHWAIAAV
ncbi:MAG: DUF3307 domain-containing protein [Rhodopirellula sp.]|nr:DUF3307 domain-containing protein [Rhodopirellula sp.]